MNIWQKVKEKYLLFEYIWYSLKKKKFIENFFLTQTEIYRPTKNIWWPIDRLVARNLLYILLNDKLLFSTYLKSLNSYTKQFPRRWAIWLSLEKIISESRFKTNTRDDHDYELAIEYICYLYQNGKAFPGQGSGSFPPKATSLRNYGKVFSLGKKFWCAILETRTTDMIDWCARNTVGKWEVDNLTIYFANKKDLVSFKMVFAHQIVRTMQHEREF